MNGQNVHYDYGSDSLTATDYIMSHLSSISDSQSGETDAVYTYLGLGTIVKEDYQQAGVMLTYLEG